MAISWTQTMEERLLRLERRQERLLQKINALADVMARQQEDLGTQAAQPPEPAPPSHPPPAVVLPAAPMAGGQAPAAPNLGMWVPPRGGLLAPRDQRARVLRRVETLTSTVRSLSQAVQRLESICCLLGQCVTLAVDNKAQPVHTHAAGGDNGGAGAGMAGALAGLLPGLLAGQGQSGAGEGHEAGAEGESGNAGAAALIPLLQAVLANRAGGGGEGGARLAGLLNSPLIQQLLQRR